MIAPEASRKRDRWSVAMRATTPSSTMMMAMTIPGGGGGGRGIAQCDLTAYAGAESAGSCLDKDTHTRRWTTAMTMATVITATIATTAAATTATTRAWWWNNRALEMKARMHVGLIHRQMAEEEELGKGGLPVQVGHANNVSSLCLVLSATPNGCTHQDKGKGERELPVQVGRFHNMSSLGLALSSVHHEFSREDTQQSSSFKICSVCARTLPHSDFSHRQYHSRLRKCKSCITQLDNNGTRGQVLLHNHRMSNGLVDGILHDVPGKKTQDQAICCTKDDRTVTCEILNLFLSKFPVKVIALPRERRVTAR